MNKKIRTEIAVGVLLAAVAIASIIIWLFGRSMANQMLISSSGSNIQSKSNYLEEYCLNKKGALENWQENNGQLKMKCRLPDQQLCGLDELYLGNCPEPVRERYFEPDSAMCQEYSNVLEKIGEVSSETKDINPYGKHMHGNLCAITAEKGTYLPNYYHQKENEIIDFLGRKGWKNTGKGGDLGGISAGGSRDIYEKGRVILVFERGYERKNTQVETCREKDSQGLEDLDSCLGKLEQTLTYTLMIGKEEGAP